MGLFKKREPVDYSSLKSKPDVKMPECAKPAQFISSPTGVLGNTPADTKIATEHQLKELELKVAQKFSAHRELLDQHFAQLSTVDDRIDKSEDQAVKRAVLQWQPGLEAVEGRLNRKIDKLIEEDAAIRIQSDKHFLIGQARLDREVLNLRTMERQLEDLQLNQELLLAQLKLKVTVTDHKYAFVENVSTETTAFNTTVAEMHKELAEGRIVQVIYGEQASRKILVPTEEKKGKK